MERTRWHARTAVREEDGARMAAPAPARGAPGPEGTAAEPHPAAVLRRALALPGGPTPADALRLQRTLGNRAVGRLLAGARAGAAPPAVQRYHVLDPAQEAERYSLPWRAGTNTMFPASQKAELTDDAGALSYDTLSPDKGPRGALPRLRVSDGGEIAIEEEGGREQKVFFASAEVLGRSQQTLKDIGSRNTVAGTGRKISVPYGDGTVSLEQVEPRVEGQRAQRFQNLSSECNAAATEIFNRDGVAEKVLLGTRGQHAVDSGDETQRAITALVPTPELSAQGLAQGVTPVPAAQDLDAAGELLHLFPGVGRIAPALLAVYADTTTPPAARREMVVRLREWAPGVERGWYQSAGLEGGAEDALREAWGEGAPFRAKEIAGRHRDLEALTAYAARNQANDRTFGINAYAAPEVGETFATFSTAPEGFGSARVDVGLQAGGVGDLGLALADELNATVHAVDGALRALEAGAPRSWTWHYAAVVARDGHDAVTLENYNRKSEDLSVVMAKVEELYALHPHLARIRKSVNDMIEMRHGEQIDPGHAESYRKDALKAAGVLRELGMSFTSDTQPHGQRWFFQMYGPVKSQPGQADDQSFHHAWTQRAGDFSNPLTVRLAAAADPVFKQAMIQELDTRIDANLSSWQTDDRAEMKTRYALAINAAATRTEVARVLQDAVEEARRNKESTLFWALGKLLSPLLAYPE